jgi:hypothetical protein
MSIPEIYVTCDGDRLSLGGLDGEEQLLVARLMKRAATKPDWDDFSRFYFKTVADFYAARGLTGRQTTQTLVWNIAQDLNSRIALASGEVVPSEYRDDLHRLIRDNYKTKRAFCKATGLSEDQLSHVLARRKHFAIDTLTEALGRIGYRLRITPKIAVPTTSAATKPKKRLLA